jgi:hypothetical protein
MALPSHRIPYSPIIDRPIIRWPKQARVALCAGTGVFRSVDMRRC